MVAKRQSAEYVPSPVCSCSRKRTGRAGQAYRRPVLSSSRMGAPCRVPAECQELIFAREGDKQVTSMAKELSQDPATRWNSASYGHYDKNAPRDKRAEVSIAGFFWGNALGFQRRRRQFQM